MSLIDEMMEPFCVMQKDATPDGAGGNTAVWTEGAPFDAAVTTRQSVVQRIGDKPTLYTTLSLYAPRDIGLKTHDVIKRLSDGATFRLKGNSNNMRTPESASFSFSVTEVEEWGLVT